MRDKKKERLLNIPNIFSTLRILLIPVFLYMMLHQKALAALIVFLVASSTDILDGMAARLWHQKTKLGALLDPAADKLLMTASIIILSFPSLSHPNTIPLWLTLLIVSRDVAIVTSAYVLYRLRDQKTFPPSILGKASTVFQMGILLLVLFLNVLKLSPPWLRWVYITTFVLTFLSGVQYGFWGCRILSRPRPQEL
jgi:cardiolipin synthase